MEASLLMMSDKVRVYDLARDKAPESLDEKLRKKVQAEITRQVIAISPKYGQSPKAASSSIDASSVDEIFSEIDIDQIIEEQGSKKTRSSKASKAKAEAPKEEAPPAKKKLKIVRRLGPAGAEAEAPGEEKPEEKVEAPSSDTAAPVQEAKPEEAVEPDLKPDHLDEMVKTIEKKKQPVLKQEPAVARKLDNVKAIPLKQMSGGQPYRVGKPTLMPQGMGRKKKKQSPEERAQSKPRPKKVEVEAKPKELYVSDIMTVRELSQKLEIPETEIITYFFMKGVVKTVNDPLEKNLILDYAESINCIVHEETEDEHEELIETLAQDETEGVLERRPPVVTIMGHVDHGKTTLLDALRETKANVVDTESGGITQHIGAYQVTTHDYDGNDRKITFLDTPGHEAFTAMRKRGANVTDMVILIVAADDGVMPQTIEAIEHTKKAGVPFVVAVNKVDKPEANTDKILGQLAEHNIVVEQYGGPVVCSFISAKQGTNLEELLEKIILVADAELDETIKSNPNRSAIGTIIEAELSRSKGPIATVLIQNGTLRKGDCVSAGPVSGRIRAMFDDHGEEVESAPPSTPVKILGLTAVPGAGDRFKAHASPQEAKKEAENLAQEALEEKRLRGLAAFTSELREGQESELQVIIKADVQGSAEAVAHELNKLSTDEVLVKPISIESGSVTSKDVDLAERTGAAIIAFHVGPDAATAKQAQKAEVKIKTYEVIYKLVEDVRRAVMGLHEPEKEEIKLGSLEVRKIFTIGKSKKVAGCMVTGGKVVRNEIARVMREGVQIYEGRVDYLKRFKDDAKEVNEGFECGLSFEKYNDLEENDVIECWTIKEIARTSF